MNHRSSHGAIESGAKNRRNTIIWFGVATVVLLAPVLLYAFGANPPLGYTGAPGQGTCASCHGTLTSGSGVTVNAPASYAAGGGPVSMTVTIPSTGGFELAVLTQSGNAQAGALAAGPPPPGAAFPQDAVSTVGSIQYVYSTVETTSWTFSWTPPGTNVGNVVVYVTGGGHSPNYANSYVLTAPATAPTLRANPTSLTFTVNGAPPPTQTLQITSSGAPISVTTSASTTTGGNWLTVMPPGGNTPVTATVGVVATGLAAGTYQGQVSFSSASAGNSPLSVPVTLNVITPLPPPVPSLDLSVPSLNFAATAGVTPPLQVVMLTTSDGSAVTYNASASTTSGGTWLFVSPGTGTTPGTESVSVNLAGLAAGIYRGDVTFTSSAVSNSPVTLPVTLTVTPGTPPNEPLRFSFVVIDRQSGGTDWMLLDGTGSVSSRGEVEGKGFFTVFNPSSSGNPTVVATGTWRATSATSFTPVSGSDSGGVLVLQVRLKTQGGPSSTGTMTISDTGSSSGVALAIDAGATFAPTGVGRVLLLSEENGERREEREKNEKGERREREQ